VIAPSRRPAFALLAWPDQDRSCRTIAIGQLPEVTVHIGTLVLIVWLIIGAIAAGQRHEYTSQPRNCNQAATAAVTILAGPLNYLGADPKISCHLPQPSK
jgi:hypothetical protein